MDKDISVTLKVWRQRGPKEKGQFETYKIEKINQSVSFLEMLDILNEQLVNEGKEPIVFDHDCREGICGMCSLYVNGHPHGPATGATTCQLYMRRFHDGETITIEPCRSAGFPVTTKSSKRVVSHLSTQVVYPTLMRYLSQRRTQT